jgi:uncharacterized protein YndB with AHSA1/START domain
MNMQRPVTVRVVRSFSVLPERVFDAWLDTAMIGQWMFGPRLRDEEVVRLSIDARVGGRFSFVVRRQGEEIDHVGTYLEIDRPRRLVFTWGVGQGDSSRVTVDIVAMGTGCELTLIHELHPDWADYAGRTEAGWTKMIEALRATVGGEAERTETEDSAGASG